MEKPKATKQLAFLAMLFICANFLLRICAAVFPELYLGLFYAEEPEIPTAFPYLLMINAACVLPLGGVCFWSWRQTALMQNQASGTLILSIIFYLFQGAAGYVMGFWKTVAAFGGISASDLAIYSAMNSVQNLFSFCIIVALVLICCSASIELYITRSLTSKQ